VIKNILIIGYVWPEPNSSAAGSRMLQLINAFLQQSWRVTFASAANLSEHRIDLPALGVEEKIIALNCSSFDEYLDELQPDVVMFDRFFTEEQFGWRVANTCPNALRVLNTEDLHSLRNVRQQLLKTRQQSAATEAEKYQLYPPADTTETLHELMASDDMAQREIAAIYRCDITLIISRFEYQLLQQAFSVPEALLHYCPFLLPPATSTPPAFVQRQDFISIGNFRHEPNWDAVLCLKHQIWPRLRAQLPHAQLHIYGAYPPPKATALHNPKQGFLVRGWADDAHEVMQHARVCLAPLRFGAGLKGKLIDAMQCGTPSVTTPIGAEGISVAEHWPGFIADELEQFLTAAVNFYESPGLWQAAQDRCANRLQQFSATTLIPILVNKLETTIDMLAAHRRRNFIGAMLQHHQHKSTQYMSLWIEAKTRNTRQD
jgi:glycosyltransferase involved in cell wall biosynthesis